MRFKTIHAGGKPWLWPSHDTQLIQVFDQVNDLETVLRYVKKRTVCVQAGGACGVWPLELSKHFTTVYTFEPDCTNYECLVANAGGRNIVIGYAALSNKSERVRVKVDEKEAANCGAGYIVPDELGISTVRIDDMGLDACGLICLDVEGSELDALKGAEETIRKFHPVISFEEKSLPHLHLFNRSSGDVEKWLWQLGYQVVATVNRDVVMA